MADLFSCSKFDEIVYLFQGGGALGAFQVGVYQALEEANYTPDWIVGISIGAINAAIIAGNPEACRIKKLQQFWDAITHDIEPTRDYSQAQNPELLKVYNLCSALYALNFGQKNFFKVAPINPWFVNKVDPSQISYYDTRSLRKTLHKVIDFDYLNHSPIRLSLGAVNVETGKLKFFDNKKHMIEVEHIVASCALPPAFPAVKIEGAYYWDGGLYSNTPLICVINDLPRKNRLCFLVDLFDSTGLMPENMDAVLERAKDITYAGHLDIMLDYYDLHLLLQKKVASCIEKLPDEVRKLPEIIELSKLGDSHNVHISKIVYQAKAQDLHSKDYEFSNYSARRRLKEGYLHTKKLLANPAWWNSREENVGTLVHPSPEDLNIVIGSCSCKKGGHYGS